MHLNIKNGDAHRFARDLARLTGESMTEAVTTAIRERLEREIARRRRREGLARRLLALGDECAALPLLDDRSPDEILYDEDGLPR